MKQADATDRTPSAIKMKAPETKTKKAIKLTVFQVANSWILVLQCSLVSTLRTKSIGSSVAMLTARQITSPEDNTIQK
jgi:hypothetical protein